MLPLLDGELELSSTHTIQSCITETIGQMKDTELNISTEKEILGYSELIKTVEDPNSATVIN